LLPPRPDDADRVRVEERLPPAPFFERRRDDGLEFVERSLARPRSLLVDCRWLPLLRRVEPPRASFAELLRPLAILARLL
jgi:hypothetical protein